MKKYIFNKIYSLLFDISVFLAIVAIYCRCIVINVDIYTLTDTAFLIIFLIGILIAITIASLLHRLFVKSKTAYQ